MNFTAAIETDQTANVVPCREILTADIPADFIPENNNQLANQHLATETGPGNRLSRITEPIKQDLNEIDKQRRPIVLLKVLGAAAIVGANAAHVRAFATPLEMSVSEAANTPFAGVALGTAIHIAWFGTYSHAVRNVYKEMPHILVGAGKRLSVDKLPLPGLNPETEKLDELANPEDPSKRRFKNFKRRAGRAAIMQATPTITYITAAASQGQTDQQQKELCNQTAVDGALGSMGKGIIIAAALTAIGLFEPSVPKSFYEFGETAEGAIIINGLPLGINGLIHSVKKLAPRLNNKFNNTAADNPLPVV